MLNPLTQVADKRLPRSNADRLRAYRQRRARHLRAKRHGVSVQFPLLICKL